MQVEFAFSLKDKVTIPSGVGAEINGLWIGRQGQKKVSVEFTNKETGAIIEQWFDEDQVKLVQ